MPELTLTLKQDKRTVAVACDGTESHIFSLLDLSFTKAQVEAFFTRPAEYGNRLYQALFPPDSASREALRAGGTLILRLEDSQLNQFPWEYLHDGKRWLAAEYGLVRTVAPASVPPGLAAPERLRLLFVPADPLLHGDQPAPYRLGLDAEWDDLLRDLQTADPAVDLIRVRPPTVAALQSAAAGMQAGIVHFTGHGTVEKDTAYLLFEQENGAAYPLKADQFAAFLRGKAALVVLSACLSATPGESLEANLAARLCAEGTPFVLGMQLSVPDLAARRFTNAFYHSLFAGESVYEAARQGRLAVLNDPALPEAQRELLMGLPALYAADPSLPGLLRPAGNGLRLTDLARPALEGLPTIESGFFGRQRELVEIGSLLTADRARDGETFAPRVVTLHGVGGVGKTALLIKAAVRFGWHFRDGVLAVPLEPLPSLEQVFDRLEKFLALPEGRLLERPARAARLLTVLQGRDLLLALDNFESLFKARESGADEQKETAALLYEFFEQTPARGPALLISSREKTELPGERLVPVHGLADEAGAALFHSLVTARRAELTAGACLAVSRAVDGHPLALRLLAPLFDRGEGRDVQDFLNHLEENLRKAAKKMARGGRHDTLQACFDFSLSHLEKTEPALAGALARLSQFSGAFPAWLAAPVLYGRGRILESEESQNKAFQEAAATLLRLWEFGQLEREVLPLDKTTALDFYSLHPALRPFAAERLSKEEIASAEDGFFLAMQHLGRICYPASEGGGIHARYDLALTALRALPDLRRAAGLKSDADGAALRFYAAFLLTHFGDLDGAMSLYQQSLEIKERLGDLQGKSATLHQMAGIYVTRGDLDGAMSLYQQSLEIKERLGDLKGKSATLAMMAQIYVTRGDLDGAMRLYQQALAILEGLGDLKGKSATLHQMAGIYVTRGDLDGAMSLYQQSLEIDERLGDLKGKSATLHQMAGIYVTRGDLDGAMRLYQQALAILEGLGDLQGKAATLGMMGQVLWHFQKYEEGLRALLDSLGTLLKMGARLDAEKVAGIIQSARQNLGAEKFDPLWREVTGQEPPDWLAQAPRQELMTVEEFITRTIQAARQKKPEAEQFFAAVSKMAADPDAPPQLQALGEALRRILAGETTPDLSALPEAWAALIRSLL